MKRILLTLIFICLPVLSLASNLAKGNGVIVDDVAQDVLCSNDKPICQSELINSLNQYYNHQQDVFYVFADFASIIQLPKAGLSDANLHCDSDIYQYVINYSSLPLIKQSILNLPELGQCLSGREVTQLYRSLDNKGQIRLVIPMINGNSDLLNTATSAQLTQLANVIAQVINEDLNAWGVAFDLENPSMSKETITQFIGPLAEKLKENNKFVAIFDADLEALAPLSSKYQNIIALVALYDYGLNETSPYSPIALNQYQSYTQKHAVPGYFGGFGKDIPVLFVTPAAATTTLWETLDVYNTNFSKGIDPNLSYPVETCNAVDMPESILSQFLTLANAKLSPNAISEFIAYCKAYQNPQNIRQIDYFSASLDAITKGYKISQSDHKQLLGVVLYNQKPSGFYAINCAKHSYSIYDTPSLYKKCLGFYPETITSNIWQRLSQWEIPSESARQNSWVFTP